MAIIIAVQIMITKKPRYLNRKHVSKRGVIAIIPPYIGKHTIYNPRQQRNVDKTIARRFLNEHVISLSDQYFNVYILLHSQICDQLDKTGIPFYNRL